MAPEPALEIGALCVITSFVMGHRFEDCYAEDGHPMLWTGADDECGVGLRRR